MAEGMNTAKAREFLRSQPSITVGLWRKSVAHWHKFFIEGHRCADDLYFYRRAQVELKKARQARYARWLEYQRNDPEIQKAMAELPF